jgi:hypothetical protein
MKSKKIWKEKSNLTNQVRSILPAKWKPSEKQGELNQQHHQTELQAYPSPYEPFSDLIRPLEPVNGNRYKVEHRSDIYKHEYTKQWH